jgi:hypothetical protein
MTPDVSVLVAASRSDHPHHAVARAWRMQALAQATQGQPLKLQPMVLASVLRLLTHPRIFVQPTPMAEALRFVDALLAAAVLHQGEHRVSLDADFKRLLLKAQFTQLKG